MKIRDAKEKKGLVISSEIALNKFKKYQHAIAVSKHHKPPVFIPTGLFIKGVENDPAPTTSKAPQFF